MNIEEIFIIKSEMANDSNSICDNAKFIGITKMPIDIKLLNFIIRLAYFGLFLVTKASMPEESKMVMSAFSESIAWQIGSVISTRLSNTV